MLRLILGMKPKKKIVQNYGYNCGNYAYDVMGWPGDGL